MNGPIFIGVFAFERDILDATSAARHDGHEIVDVYTPYALHGLDRAIGLRPSRLPWVCFVLGLVGAASAAWVQYWTSVVDWPINVGGKPWHSWPAFMPVIFEVMILFAGVGTVLCFIAWAGLRPGRRSPVSGLRVTDDRFALVIRARPEFDRSSAEALFARFHAVSIEERRVSHPVTGVGA